MRRDNLPLSGAKYCANTNKMEVHDLDNEQTGCQIDEIIEADHAVPYNSLAEAQKKGYDNCAWCLGGSER